MWFYTYVCINAALCAHGVPAVTADGYYDTKAQCVAAAKRDWYFRYSDGRTIVCQQAD
jgi:hypothetical protein